MSPYADFPKSNRISMEWGRETIEMQENGSTKNLLQMTDIYYSVRVGPAFISSRITPLKLFALEIIFFQQKCWLNTTHTFPLSVCVCALSLSLHYVTPTWREMGCTHSRAFRGLATRVSTRLSGTLPSSATTRGEETISNSPTLTKNTHDTCYL